MRIARKAPWLAAAVFAAACTGGPSWTETGAEEPFLLTPTEEGIDAAQAIRRLHPGATIRMSQRHGHPLAVLAGPSPYPADGEDVPPLRPLVASLGADRASRAAALVAFFAEHAAVFGLRDPATELRSPVDPVNGELGAGDEPSNDPLPLVAELVHTHEGLRVEGRHAVGLFDPEGNLLAVIARLLPLPDGLDPTPAFGADALPQRLASLRGELIARAPTLRWLEQIRDLGKAPRSAELLFHPRGARADAELVLAWSVRLRAGPNELHAIVDAKSGALLEAFDALPTEWVADGTTVRASATTELGVARTIPSTRDGGTLVMGLNPSFLSGGLFAAGQFVAISDSAERENRGWVYFDPISQEAAANAWALEGTSRAAAELMRNLDATFRWWHARSWRSWDGRGSALWAGVHVNKSATPETTPDLNAWGGGGFVQFGDGVTSSGQYAGSSLEVVGHEFMHNVVGATSRLAYQGESGAANEALADFFGVALSGEGDDFASDRIGDDAGWGIRDVVRPSLSRQPESYSAYVLTEADSGGVHTNSGILNKAHALLVRGGAFRGFEVPRIGLGRTEELLRQANAIRAFRPEASLEEVATGVLAFCDLTRVLMARFGNPRAAEREETCAAFQLAYTATELLPGTLGADLAVESAVVDHRGTTLSLRNLSSATLELSHFEVQVVDELGETVSVPLAYARVEDENGLASGTMRAGGRVRAILRDLEPRWFGPDARRIVRRLRFGVVPRAGRPKADLDLANNWIRVEHGSDYLAYGASFTDDRPAAESASLRGLVRNQSSRIGLAEGLRVAFFERTGASGPLLPLEGMPAHEATLPAAVGDDGRLLPPIVAALGANDPSPVPELVVVEGARGSRWTERVGTEDRAIPELWLQADGSYPPFGDARQLYMLVDADDRIEELDERDNLVCVNCRVPEQAGTIRGVLVRIPRGADVDALFPAPYRAAARKLVDTEPPRLAVPLEVRALPYRFEAPSPRGLVIDF